MVREGAAITDLEVYPNPSRDIFNVSFVSDEVQNLTIWLVVLTSLLIALTVFQFYVSIYVPAYLSPKTNPKTNTIIQKETQNKFFQHDLKTHTELDPSL